ncbi:MAG TPA: sigma-70 family RNA polymerase sigma factor [Candidatus Sulfopaludibacter sp.]|nr:sigma-70 family RNA polymerase sigma factor [Candidatus Sulfopaludibacter sp.]
MELAARNEMVERYRPLAGRVAAEQAARTGRPFDELLSCAYLGLMRAAAAFQPQRGANFVTWAVPHMVGAMREEARDSVWRSRSARDYGKQIRAAGSGLAEQLGREPSDGELARELCWPVEDLVRRRLDADRGEIGRLDDLDWMADGARDPAALIERREGGRELTIAVRALSDRQRAAIVSYFWGGLTWRQVGARLRCSESGAYKAHAAGLERLRAVLGADWAWR